MMADSDSDSDIPLSSLENKSKEKKLNEDIGLEMDDEIPLSALRSKIKDKNIHGETVGLEQCVVEDREDVTSDKNETSSNNESECYYDSDRDPEYSPGLCEVRKCKREVWAACPLCEILLCFDHFEQEVFSCDKHGERMNKKRKRTQVLRLENTDTNETPITATARVASESIPQATGRLPEDYTVEGNRREVSRAKVPRLNKQKEAKRKRNLGQEYTSVASKKNVGAKQMKARCKTIGNKQCQRQCSTITDDQRRVVFDSFHALGDLRLKREHLVRHIKCVPKKRTTNGQTASRRQQSKQYFLTVDSNTIHVCKVFFLNTLGISEQFTRTALGKISSLGVLEGEMRGGIQSKAIIERNQSIRKEVSDHIDRFPRVESHFCRAFSSREYISSDLTKRKMYDMFIEEWKPKPEPPSFVFYKKVFRENNLSIHRPKKDQCSLCATFLKGDETSRQDLKAEYETHILEKQKVREIKAQCKKNAEEDDTVLCASFDLQQVIYLPVSKESAIFYKRRLSNYNLTFYSIGDRSCHCFTWNETMSKRGSSEISTSVYKALKFYDENGTKKAYLFSDGCAGQNKNSITPAMLLYVLSKSTNLEEISLRFFATNHGQNEGDSAHSAISQAIKTAGDLFLPSQLTTVFSLARPKQPYIVHSLQWDDFYDFKTLSKDLRILEARRGSDAEEINWNNIMEMFVTKCHLDTIFVKTSHNEEQFKALVLKRLKKPVKEYTLQKLNTGPNKISKEKFDDLSSLCTGNTPVVKIPEHKDFYLSLPHS